MGQLRSNVGVIYTYASSGPQLLLLCCFWWHRTGLQSDLLKRRVSQLGPHPRMEMLTLIPSIAVPLAASMLTNFYSLIVDRVQGGPQSLGNPGIFKAFEWNDLRLEFSSDAGAIPWELIAAFARHMVFKTQRGFTGQFNAVYVHMATERSIRVSLKVLQNAVGIERTGQNY